MNLTATAEICDKGGCPAPALTRFLFKNGEGELVFCGHHGKEFAKEMPLFDWAEFVEKHPEIGPNR